MGQQEILDFLESIDKPLSGREVAEALDEGLTKVMKLLSILLEHDDISAVEIDGKSAKKKFGSPRRMRLYYLPGKFKQYSPEDIIKIRFTVQ